MDNSTALAANISLYTLNYNSDHESGSAQDNVTKTNSTIQQEAAYRAAVMLARVAFPALVALGTVSNALVLVVLRRGAISTGNLSFFLAALAVVDTVFLYSSGAKTWIRAEWGVELLHLGTWSCQAVLFVNHLSCSLSAWLVVLVAWQRWYTLSRPFQRCCPVENKRCGHLGFVCLVLVLTAANSYVFVTVKLYERARGKVCAPREPYRQVMRDVFPYVLMVLYSGLPSLLLILLNCLLARVLYVSRRSLLTSGDCTRSSGGSHDAEHVRTRFNHVTTMLLVLSASWLVLTAPHTLLQLVDPHPKSQEEAARLVLLNVLFFVFIYINHSINFFLYCALIRGFRREARAVISKALAFFRLCRSEYCFDQDNNSSSNIAANISHHHHRVDGNGNAGSFAPLLCRHGLAAQGHDIQEAPLTEFPPVMG
ncbi:hypothetical protein EGW08_009024 [Elysia chlorotica]|uniref:G-protein coupled receptors family 1 profile domain-containing protein n=1 Tax=Elysia chlorotica TaxID=188477 RepID=A0A433TNR1_ELYCH|nr:hypothetical protein EGW08_009024 [Elysia chlorotica]